MSATTLPDDPSRRGRSLPADVVRAWTDAATRLLLVLATTLILVVPQWFPFLRQFTLKSGDVNIFGSKFEITQVGTLIPGLEIRDGRLLLWGDDVSQYPDTIGRVKSDNSQLLVINADLNERLKSIGALLDQATAQRDDANRRLAGLAPTQPSARPVETAELDKKIQQLAQTRPLAIADAAAATASAPAAAQLYFGVVLGADTDKSAAMDEVRKALALDVAPIALFQRQKFIRTVAAFAGRDGATQALPAFRVKWPTAYIVDLRSWCPAALNAALPAGPAPADIDCRF